MRVVELECLEVVNVAGDKQRGVIPGMNCIIKATANRRIDQVPGGYLIVCEGSNTDTFVPLTNVKRAWIERATESTDAVKKGGKAA